jgi:hypothetical protein
MADGSPTGEAKPASDAQVAAADGQPAAERAHDRIAESLLEMALALGAVSLVACGGLMLAGHIGFPPPRSSSAWSVGFFGVGAALSLLVVRELWLWRRFVHTQDEIPEVLTWLAAGGAIVVFLKLPAFGSSMFGLLFQYGAKMAALVGLMSAYVLLASEHRERVNRLYVTVLLLFATVTWWGLAF